MNTHYFLMIKVEHYYSLNPLLVKFAIILDALQLDSFTGKPIPITFPEKNFVMILYVRHSHSITWANSV